MNKTQFQAPDGAFSTHQTSDKLLRSVCEQQGDHQKLDHLSGDCDPTLCRRSYAVLKPHLSDQAHGYMRLPWLGRELVENDLQLASGLAPAISNPDVREINQNHDLPSRLQTRAQIQYLCR